MAKQDKKAIADFDEYEKHKVPRKFNHKKKHKSGYSEDTVANRQARIGFKNYLRELEEEELDDSLNDEDFE